jgi:hypothetical protein
MVTMLLVGVINRGGLFLMGEEPQQIGILHWNNYILYRPELLMAIYLGSYGGPNGGGCFTLHPAPCTPHPAPCTLSEVPLQIGVLNWNNYIVYRLESLMAIYSTFRYYLVWRCVRDAFLQVTSPPLGHNISGLDSLIPALTVLFKAGIRP